MIIMKLIEILELSTCVKWMVKGNGFLDSVHYTLQCQFAGKGLEVCTRPREKHCAARARKIRRNVQLGAWTEAKKASVFFLLFCPLLFPWTAPLNLLQQPEWHQCPGSYPQIRIKFVYLSKKIHTTKIIFRKVLLGLTGGQFLSFLEFLLIRRWVLIGWWLSYLLVKILKRVLIRGIIQNNFLVGVDRDYSFCLHFFRGSGRVIFYFFRNLKKILLKY